MFCFWKKEGDLRPSHFILLSLFVAAWLGSMKQFNLNHLGQVPIIEVRKQKPKEVKVSDLPKDTLVAEPWPRPLKSEPKYSTSYVHIRTLSHNLNMFLKDSLSLPLKALPLTCRSTLACSCVTIHIPSNQW